jgi:hypothetical protein
MRLRMSTSTPTSEIFTREDFVRSSPCMSGAWLVAQGWRHHALRHMTARGLPHLFALADHLHYNRPHCLVPLSPPPRPGHHPSSEQTSCGTVPIAGDGKKETNKIMWRACNLTSFSPCLTGPVDYPFAFRHKRPGFKSPEAHLCETGILLLALSHYIGDPNVIDHCGLVLNRH